MYINWQLHSNKSPDLFWSDSNLGHLLSFVLNSQAQPREPNRVVGIYPRMNYNFLGRLWEDEEDLDDESNQSEAWRIFEIGHQSIFQAESLCSLPFTTPNYSAAGEVRLHTLDDLSELDDLEYHSVATILGSPQTGKFSKIMSINLHHYDSESGVHWLVS